LKKIRRLRELQNYKEILNMYKLCNSCKITAYKLKIPYWYVKDMLEYFNYKIPKETPYKNMKSDTEDIVRLIEKGYSNKQIGEMCFRRTDAVGSIRKRLEESNRVRKNLNMWLKQLNTTEKEIEDWYLKTRRKKSRR